MMDMISTNTDSLLAGSQYTDAYTCLLVYHVGDVRLVLSVY